MHSRRTTEFDIVETILALVQLVSLGSALFGLLGYLSAPAAVEVGCKSYLGISDVCIRGYRSSPWCSRSLWPA